jgi:hypothetical protein
LNKKLKGLKIFLKSLHSLSYSKFSRAPLPLQKQQPNHLFSKSEISPRNIGTRRHILSSMDQCFYEIAATAYGFQFRPLISGLDEQRIIDSFGGQVRRLAMKQFCPDELSITLTLLILIPSSVPLFR